jgi:thiamine biosynthesis protein ThiI
MNRVILIKYGELTTKKDNRKMFVNVLHKNIVNKLKGIDVFIYKDLSRMYIEFDEKDLDVILNKMNKIFGIYAYTVAYKVYSSTEAIEEAIKDILSTTNFKTFKVETKRSDKNFPIQSIEFSKMMGGVILKNKDNIKVDVHNPEITFNIEIRRNETFIYFKDYQGAGGYPNGTQGKGLLMLSGGIDSPVAGYLAMKRGITLDCVYFEAIPHTSIEARNKVIELSKKLLDYTNNINLYVVPFTEIQEAIYSKVDPEYVITIMRRMMYRIMDKLVKKYHAHVIINGESIGQVASQTLTSMEVINNVTNIPVIRPVACLDKLEIISISEKIDTYNISILPYEDCCTVFVPRHPVINPSLEKSINEENKINYDELIDRAIDNILTISLNEKPNEYEGLL